MRDKYPASILTVSPGIVRLEVTPEEGEELRRLKRAQDLENTRALIQGKLARAARQLERLEEVARGKRRRRNRWPPSRVERPFWRPNPEVELYARPAETDEEDIPLAVLWLMGASSETTPSETPTESWAL